MKINLLISISLQLIPKPAVYLSNPTKKKFLFWQSQLGNRTLICLRHDLPMEKKMILFTIFLHMINEQRGILELSSIACTQKLNSAYLLTIIVLKCLASVFSQMPYIDLWIVAFILPFYFFSYFKYFLLRQGEDYNYILILKAQSVLSACICTDLLSLCSLLDNSYSVTVCIWFLV